MPGFKQTNIGPVPEDWNVISMGEIGHFKNGINKDSEAFGHGYPFINLMDVFGVNAIRSGTKLGLVNSTEAEQRTYDLKRGDVIFIRSSVKPSGVGLTAVVEVDLPRTVYSGFLIRFRDNGILDLDFKRYCFYSEKFRNNLIGASSVSANTNINQDNLKKLLIALPPTFNEQHAIASALSDIDSLLEISEKMIAKKRNLKQAMMQRLLTGKYRLSGFSQMWEIKNLGEIASITKGKQLDSIASIAEGMHPHFNGGIYPSSYTNKFNTPANTIAISEGGNSCGYVQLISRPFWCGGHCYAVTAKHVHNQFLYHALKIEQKSIQGLRVGSGLPNVQKTALTKFKLNIPSDPAEQESIALILSNMDDEIKKLESYKEKIYLLKKGMMQELLTGRTRLV